MTNIQSISVVAWSNLVNSLVGTIGAVVNGSIGTASAAINSAINTLGTNIQVPGGVQSMSAFCVVLSMFMYLPNVSSMLVVERCCVVVAACRFHDHSGMGGVFMSFSMLSLFYAL